MLALDAAREHNLAAIPESQAKTDGMAVGTAAADAIIALRMNDGSAAPLSMGSTARDRRATTS